MLMRNDLERVSVVGLDPELVRDCDATRRGLAERLSVARVQRSEPGIWQPRCVPDDGLGFLVLGGLLVRRIVVEGRGCAELLGPGDVLCPSAVGGDEPVVRFHAGCRVLWPLRVAVLDGRWMKRMAPFPGVATQLSERLLERCRRLLRLATIAQERRLEDRVRLTFVELADRFGHVHPDGIHLDLPVTHELLAEMVCARRPSVSAAVGRLAREGTLTRSGRRWMLSAPLETRRSSRAAGRR
jgi:CRP/FNR family transcriptional regulator, cyclic AMP receptor protein